MDPDDLLKKEKGKGGEIMNHLKLAAKVLFFGAIYAYLIFVILISVFSWVGVYKYEQPKNLVRVGQSLEMLPNK